MVTKTGLILEGGGMRAAFTAGVLECFQDHNLHFPFISAASSSALVGSYYVAKQKGATLDVLKSILSNKQSISFRRMIKNKELFEMNYIFQKVPTEIVPLSFDRIAHADATFLITVTDLLTGKPIYIDKYEQIDDLLTIIRASSSLPILAPSVSYKGLQLMDGGISDAIPLAPSIEAGNQKHVVILTRNRGYVKKRTWLGWLFKRVFRQYPQFYNLLMNRHHDYNRTMQQINELEKRNEAFIIMPEAPMVSSRTERNEKKLHDLYLQGYNETARKIDALLTFLEQPNQSKSQAG